MIPGLEVHLATLAASGQTTTYGTLARDLGLTGPNTIAQLTEALEALMDQDAAANYPLRAVLLTAKGSTLPAQGFFQKAAALGRFHGTDQAQFIAAERQALNTFTLAQILHGGPGV